MKWLLHLKISLYMSKIKKYLKALDIPKAFLLWSLHSSKIKKYIWSDQYIAYPRLYTIYVLTIYEMHLSRTKKKWWYIYLRKLTSNTYVSRVPFLHDAFVCGKKTLHIFDTTKSIIFRSIYLTCIRKYN